MKKIFTILLVFLCFQTTTVAQQNEKENKYVENTKDVPVLASGLECVYPIDSKGKNILTVKVVNVEYSDSSYISCKMHVTFLASVKGKSIKTSFLAYNYENDGLSYNYCESIKKEITIQEANDYLFDYNTFLKKSEPIAILFSVTEGNLLPKTKEWTIFKIPAYDSSVFFEKQNAIALEKQRKKEEEQQRALAVFDSINNISIDRQNMLLTPDKLANWIGAAFFTKENLEKDCNIYPVAERDRYTMYELSKCPITIVYAGTTDVCVELSFRLYGLEGQKMRQDLIDYGYKLEEKSTGDLVIENNFQDAQIGSTSIYRYKLDNGDYSNCVIVEGQSMMFTFYRTDK